VPVPLPPRGQERDTRPDEAEARILARGLVTAAAPSGGLTELQTVLIEALLVSMTDHAISVDGLEPITPGEFAAALADRNAVFRTRVVQVMLLSALVLRPLPEEVADRVTTFAHELSVEEGMLRVAQGFARGSLGIAAIDFQRNGYTNDWGAEPRAELHTSRELHDAWEEAVDDPALAARWETLAAMPPESLGHGVWRLYRARGFQYPGTPGSAPPLLAQHDWVHLLADYGTRVESELEVFAFIARANDDLRGFALLAMVVSLFETGYLRSGMGLFEYDQDHLSASGVAIRLADAMSRGAWTSDLQTGKDSTDFLRIDWFEIAHLPLSQARARFSLRPKSDAAVAAGSVGPFAPGGISEFQVASGRALAAADRRPYDSYGATVG